MLQAVRKLLTVYKREVSDLYIQMREIDAQLRVLEKQKLWNRGRIRLGDIALDLEPDEDEDEDEDDNRRGS